MRSLIPLVAAAILAVNVAGHATFHSLAERDAYQHRHKQARRALQQKCGETVKARRVRRAIARAAVDEPQHPSLKARFYDSIVARASNSSGACVLDPEVTQGPYHVLGELYRQNVTESQGGIPITYEVSFVDVNTCEPLKEAWVDVWSANATGFYSGFIAASSGAQGGSGSGMGGSNSSAPSGSMTALPSGGASFSGSMGAAPTGGAGGDGGGGGMSSAATDNESFLRGIWRTDDEGVLTMYGVVPGYYTGRTTHTHLKVYGADQGEIADNGTFVAKTGAYHTGQMFFADDFIELISKYEPYSLNKLSYNESTKNADDSIFASENSDGNDAVMDLEYDEADLFKGVVATTYIGVNTSYVSQESSISWWAGNSSSSSNDSSSTAADDSSSASTTTTSQSNSAKRNVPNFTRLFRLF